MAVVPSTKLEMSQETKRALLNFTKAINAMTATMQKNNELLQQKIWDHQALHGGAVCYGEHSPVEVDPPSEEGEPRIEVEPPSV